MQMKLQVSAKKERESDKKKLKKKYQIPFVASMGVFLEIPQRK